jgi:predicted AlkP superfamily pyrophosphatase or phosphodiesterase
MHLRALRRCLLLFAALVCVAGQASAGQSVLLISLDGLRPGDVLEADKRGLKLPNLRRFIDEGTYATDVRGVLPTLTYPSHTTLITGVAPSIHGVVSNITFDPLLKNQEGWYWYAEDIRVPTLWDAARAFRLTTANVHWPVSVGAQIDYNLPQIWRTGHADDRKLLRALATAGLLDTLESDLGAYADGIDETIEGDENRARFAERLLETRHPRFMTAYFTALDHVQHVAGIDTSEAHAVLQRLDAIVGRLLQAALRADPNAVVAVVSDHGFATLEHDVNLAGAFIDAGLVVLGGKGEISHWDAEPWYAGGSAAIVLRDKNSAATRSKVAALLERIAKDPANGIAGILTRAEIAKRHANPEAEFYVLFKPGWQMATTMKAPRVAPSGLHGMHGYDPEFAEMRATFLILGTGIPRASSLGSIDMRDIAPTLAHELGVTLAAAEGKSLF